MANNFPTAKNNFLTGVNSQALGVVGHAEEHNAMETKVGIDNSTDPSSIDYLLKNTASKNPGHFHTNGGPTLLVAASNAPTFLKNKADYVCTGANDDVQINAAIAALTASGGIVRLTEGQFSISAAIAITSSFITIEGAGYATTIFVANSANITAAITIIGTGVTLCAVKNVYINGNNAHQSSGDGIYISTPWQNSTHDTNHVLENVYIESTKNNGVEVAQSSDTRVLLFKNVRVRGASGNGFYFPQPCASDSVFDSCIAEACALNGFYIGLVNSHFINCKTFYCGSATGNYHGYYFAAYNNMLFNCQAQDNYQSGFYSKNDGDVTYGSQNNMLVGCSADSNNQSSDASYGVGLQLKDVTGWQIIGGQFYTRPYPLFTQRLGISLEGVATGNFIIGVQGSGNSSGLISDTSSGNNPVLLANGQNVSKLPSALVQKMISLTDASSIATDASLGNIFTVTLGGNRTLSNPTNPTNGQRATWRITQDGTGSRTITLGSAFNVGPFTVTLTTAAGKIDYIEAIYNGATSKWDIINFQKGY